MRAQGQQDDLTTARMEAELGPPAFGASASKHCSGVSYICLHWAEGKGVFLWLPGEDLRPVCPKTGSTTAWLCPLGHYPETEGLPHEVGLL